MICIKSVLKGNLNPSTGNSHADPDDPINSADNGWWYLDIPKDVYKHFISVEFYTEDFSTPLSPSEGSIIIEVSDNGLDFGKICGSEITLGTEYSQPNFMGVATSLRIKLNGVKSTVTPLAVKLTLTSFR